MPDWSTLSVSIHTPIDRVRLVFEKSHGGVTHNAAQGVNSVLDECIAALLLSEVDWHAGFLRRFLVFKGSFPTSSPIR